jgi:hypothetical protein
MSDKKSQQGTINEIKDILRKIGSEGFGWNNIVVLRAEYHNNP